MRRGDGSRRRARGRRRGAQRRGRSLSVGGRRPKDGCPGPAGKNCTVIEIASTTVKKRNAKRVSAKATRPTTIVAIPIRKTDQEKCCVGSKKTSFGNVPISDATP